MNPEQIRLVQASWARIQPQRAAAADLFYARLFELAPDTRPLFKRDIHAQGAMLMQVLDHVVGSLSNLGDVLPQAEALARRHVGYGVQAQHYDSVGSALLWTLEQAHGADFTPALRDAWTTAYGALAGAMKAAAHVAPPRPARATLACWETPVMALSAAFAMAFAGAPAQASVVNVSEIVRGVYDPTPMPGAGSEQACAAPYCLWTFTTAARMSNAHDSTPGMATAGQWPAPLSAIPPVLWPVAEVLAVAPAPAGQVLSGGSVAVQQAAAVNFVWQPAGPPVREAGVQTWKTGSGATAVSYAIRLTTPPGNPRHTYLEFGVPALTRSLQNAYDIGGPSGQQPISSGPESLQARAAMDVYVDGLAVWSSASHQMKPRRWQPAYLAQQQVQWGPALAGGATTLYLGLLPGGSTRTVSVVIRSDLYVDAPTCYSDSEWSGTYRRCHAQRESLSLPAVMSSTTPYGATGYTPLVRVYTK